MKTDIEISQESKMLNIKDIANKLNIQEDELELYGNYKAKINKKIENKKGKLILVTSTSPTPYGEGKTTMSIGINDALNSIGKDSLVVLREPSMGPVFGIKGGATGGGYSQVIPMEDINLHFTGDIHAITSANNLLCAAIDNHIFQGNDLKIKNVLFRRCLDLNDRALRNITINSSYNREEKFNISVASEIMAIVCLAEDINDLKEKIGNIIIGVNEDNKPVFAFELKIEDSLTIILKDAIKPNLVQTLENNPAIIHGGPFANIAHGCNSVIATKLGLSLTDYVVTEAGFGSDLGAEKFINIKCRKANIYPDVIVINTTIRSLLYNGYDDLKKGIENLNRHIENMQQFNKNIVVCINHFSKDKKEDIEYLENYLISNNVLYAISSSFEQGSRGAKDLAKIIVSFDTKPSPIFTYELTDTIYNKINSIATKIYRSNDIVISDEIKEKIKFIESINPNLPICIAKTQYSFTDNQKSLGAPTNFELTIKDIYLNNGAGFIVVLLGNIMTLPGLNKTPAYENMKISNNIISGLF